MAGKTARAVAAKAARIVMTRPAELVSGESVYRGSEDSRNSTPENVTERRDAASGRDRASSSERAGDAPLDASAGDEETEAEAGAVGADVVLAAVSGVVTRTPPGLAPPSDLELVLTSAACPLPAARSRGSIGSSAALASSLSCSASRSFSRSTAGDSCTEVVREWAEFEAMPSAEPSDHSPEPGRTSIDAIAESESSIEPEALRDAGREKEARSARDVSEASAATSCAEATSPKKGAGVALSAAAASGEAAATREDAAADADSSDARRAPSDTPSTAESASSDTPSSAASGSAGRPAAAEPSTVLADAARWNEADDERERSGVAGNDSDLDDGRRDDEPGGPRKDRGAPGPRREVVDGTRGNPGGRAPAAASTGSASKGWRAETRFEANPAATGRSSARDALNARPTSASRAASPSPTGAARTPRKDGDGDGDGGIRGVENPDPDTLGGGAG